MARLIYAIMVLIACELTLYLFGGQNGQNSSIFALFLDPSDFGHSQFYLIVFGALTVTGAVTIILGTIFTSLPHLLYIATSAFLIAFVLRIVDFWAFISNSLSAAGIQSATLISSIFVFPIALLYMLTAFDYLRGGE